MPKPLEGPHPVEVPAGLVGTCARDHRFQTDGTERLTPRPSDIHPAAFTVFRMRCPHTECGLTVTFPYRKPYTEWGWGMPRSR